MKHVNNELPNVLLKIGGMLGLEKEDILRIKKEKISEQDSKEPILKQDPADSYNGSAGYYGVISIKDFN